MNPDSLLPIAVIVPTYNEAENLPLLIRDILNLDLPARVIVVDDHSPDGTGEIADRLAVEHPGRVEVIHRPGKLGLGTAYRAGFRLALATGATLVVTMDADFSHQPCYIPDLVRRAGQEVHLCIGSRYVPGGGTRQCTLWRRFLSRGANLVAKLVLGLKTNDCTAGFRCYRREVLETVELETIFSSGYSFLVEMLYRVERRRFRVGEVPIIFENRQRGASKISRAEIYRAMYTVFRLRVQGWSWES